MHEALGSVPRRKRTRKDDREVEMEGGRKEMLDILLSI
jgi:hypothetical protein